MSDGDGRCVLIAGVCAAAPSDCNQSRNNAREKTASTFTDVGSAIFLFCFVFGEFFSELHFEQSAEFSEGPVGLLIG